MIFLYFIHQMLMPSIQEKREHQYWIDALFCLNDSRDDRARTDDLCNVTAAL